MKNKPVQFDFQVENIILSNLLNYYKCWLIFCPWTLCYSWQFPISYILIIPTYWLCLLAYPTYIRRLIFLMVRNPWVILVNYWMSNFLVLIGKVNYNGIGLLKELPEVSVRSCVWLLLSVLHLILFGSHISTAIYKRIWILFWVSKLDKMRV